MTYLTNTSIIIIVITCNKGLALAFDYWRKTRLTLALRGIVFLIVAYSLVLPEKTNTYIQFKVS